MGLTGLRYSIIWPLGIRLYQIGDSINVDSVGTFNIFLDALVGIVPEIYCRHALTLCRMVLTAATKEVTSLTLTQRVRTMVILEDAKRRINPYS